MSREEWHADIEISADTVKKVLEEQFASLRPIESIQYVDEGWDNVIFLVNKNIIFRFPRRKAAVALIERETILLNNLPRFADIKTPQLKYNGHPTATYPYPFQGYDLIKGYSGYQANLSEEDRCDNIVIIAKFLKQLHSIDANHAHQIGATSQGSGSRANIEETFKVLTDRIEKLKLRKIVKINLSLLEDETNIAHALTLSEKNHFVHGDLDCRHLIFDDKKLTGIIDWGDTDITNRAVDLAIVWTFFPSNCHPQFFDIYGPVEPSTWQYARFLGLYCAFSLILYSIDLKDNLLFIESIDAIKRINPNLLID